MEKSYYGVLRISSRAGAHPVMEEVSDNIEDAVSRLRKIFADCLKESSYTYKSMHLDDDGKHAEVVYNRWNGLKMDYYVVECTWAKGE